MVPATVPDNANDVVVPVQMVSGEGDAVTVGVGFIVMVTVMGLPAQPSLAGVIV